MDHINKPVKVVLGLFVLSGVLLFGGQAEAQTICDSSGNVCISGSSINMFGTAGVITMSA